MMFQFDGQRIVPARLHNMQAELVSENQFGRFILPKPKDNEMYIVFRDRGLGRDWIYKANNGIGEIVYLHNDNRVWEMTVDRQPIIDVSNGRLLNMDIGRSDPEGELLRALGDNDLTLTSKLLNSIPSLAQVTYDRGRTLLMLASSEPWTKPGIDLSVAKLALEAGADVNAKDTNGITSLHYAVYHDKEEMVKFLIASKANVNAQTASGDTPLHIAVGSMGKKNETLANYLAQHGANFTIKNEQGQTPISVALRN